jgi:hypothetical protein
METSREELENGKPAPRPQDDAVERLDTARDGLDNAAANAAQQLSDEKRRKMADRIKALLDKQTAAVAEANRIHGLVAGAKKWERPLLSSYKELEDQERVLAEEVRSLGEKEFAPLPVLARLLTEAANAMEAGSEKAKVRREDAVDVGNAPFDPALESANDRKVLKPMVLSERRLKQLVEALQPEQPRGRPAQSGNPAPSSGGEGGAASGQQDDVIPPLAQLKVLKALQTELNQRTKQFDLEHPEKDKLTDDERDELKELEDAQRDIAKLFEHLTELFQDRQKKQDGPEKPDDKDDGKNP